MAYICFDVDVVDKVAHLQLKRPEAFNSMVAAFWTELPEIVREIDAVGEARAIVLSSTGKHFTAGMDLAVFGAGGLEEPKPKDGKARKGERAQGCAVVFFSSRRASVASSGPVCRFSQPFKAAV
jgi:enoyl-CoA hydratase